MGICRTLAQLLGLFPDNDDAAISAGDGRDLIQTLFGHAAPSDPTADNDSVDSAGIGQFFSIGSRWTNTTTKVVFECVLDTPHIATWKVALYNGDAAGGRLTGYYPAPTLLPTGVAAGAYGDAGNYPTFTVHADGTLLLAGTQPWAPGSGTVTSVALSMPAEFAVGGSPVTTAGTLAVSKANQTPNLVYAGPSSGGAAAPTFRLLVAADIPSITLPAANLTAGAIPAGVTLPATQLTAGAIPAGVTLPATQLAAGAIPAGVTLPATQLAAGAIPAGVTLPITQLTGEDLTLSGTTPTVRVQAGGWVSDWNEFSLALGANVGGAQVRSGAYISVGGTPVWELWSGSGSAAYGVKHGGVSYVGVDGTSGGGDTVKGGIVIALGAPITGGMSQLTGDVTAGPGSGSQAATIANGAVTLAKLAAAIKPSGSAAAGDEAVRALGTTASTACAGNDARLSDTRTPTNASVTDAKLSTALEARQCKGWVQFGGIGTVTILEAYNVASITDNGTGDYTVVWDVDFAGANDYAVVGSPAWYNGVDPLFSNVLFETSSWSGASVRLYTLTYTPAAADCRVVSVQAFGTR